MSIRACLSDDSLLNCTLREEGSRPVPKGVPSVVSHSSDSVNPRDPWGDLLPQFTVTLAPDALGIPATSTLPTLQSDAFKELVNKLAWVIGSTFQAPYSGNRTVCRTYARYLAADIIRDQGYPKKIGVPDLTPH